jgi:M6 family metalloprotease-like protein
MVDLSLIQDGTMRIARFCALSLVVLILSSPETYPAYLRSVPVKVVQPGGDTLRCFASGDEFYNWLHDASGYTIMRNPLTGFYEYATLSQGKVVCTGAVAGRVDPLSLGIPRNAIAPPEERQRLRAKALARVSAPSSAPTTGTIQNLVVFVRFSDQTEFADPLSTYTELFNGTSPSSTSLLAYYREVSYNQLSINSTFYPIPSGGGIISYQDVHTRDYYLPYDANTNPGGYQSAGKEGREDSLLLRAVNAVKSQVPDALNIDSNGDGFIDNICFIIEGPVSAWADLLWPHRGSLPGGIIKGKSTGSYNFDVQGFIAIEQSSVICHEMFHTLGAPDLYHYSYDGFEPVGDWDLMAYNAIPPQHMGAYMKFRYGHWISSIPEITSTGSYTLQPLTSATNNCYRIPSLQSATEYYVLEYRRRSGSFESSLSGDGLLVYRINTAVDGIGDASGPPDEVYIYRTGGTSTVNGDYTTANMSVEAGRTQLNDQTDPSAFLSNGSPGGLNIGSIGHAVGSISFTTNGPLPIVLSSFTAVEALDGSVILRWKTLSENNNYGFLVERSAGQDPLFAVMQGSFIAGHGTTLQMQQYEWTDVSSPPPPLVYRLRQMNLDGSIHYSEPVRVDFAAASEPPQVAAVFSLRQNYPNPFNPATVIEFSVGHQGRATLTLYNPLGQSVGTLFDGETDPGHFYRLKIDGTNLASGVYFYRLKAGEFVETKKLLLMH